MKSIATGRFRCKHSISPKKIEEKSFLFIDSSDKQAVSEKRLGGGEEEEMGSCHSRLESKEAVSRCKARRRYMRQLSEGRQAFAAAHSLYLHFLRSTGTALLQFADAESRLQLQPLLPPPRPHPPPSPPRPQRPLTPPPFSPSSDNWTSSVTASPILPPPPPPPPSSSAWDFWDPFVPSSSHSVTEEEWEEAATTISEVSAAPAAAPPPSAISGYSKDSSTVELAVVSVTRGKKSISEIVKELDVYFLKASETGQRVSIILEAPSCGFSSSIHGVSGKMSSYCKSFNPMLWSRSSSPKASALPGFRDSMEEMGRTIHSSTVEKLYAWEKKLYLEVKNCERTREEKEKRLSLLRRQEAKGADYFKVEKNKREIERLESKLMVSCQAIETTSSEIIRLREVELFPQLLDLVNGLMFMWRGMYECHQVQTHIVQQLEYLNNSSSTSPTSDLHRQATLQLEAEVEHWYSAFCNLIKSQRDYIHALTGWLRLSLFQCHHKQLDKTQQNPEIYVLCEEWQLSLDRVPDKVASEGIKSFLTMIHAVVMQQAEELRQKKRSDSSFKELEKRAKELRSLECKYGPYSSEVYGDNSGRSAVMEKKAKVDALKTKAEEEKTKYEKSSGITRAMTMNNLQTGFPNVFQAMTGFSSVCVQAFGALYGHRRSSNLALN